MELGLGVISLVALQSHSKTEKDVGLSTLLPLVVDLDLSGWPGAAGNFSSVIPVIRLDATQGVRNIDVYNAHLVRLLTLGRPLVVVERMDEIGFEQEQFELIEEEFLDHLKKASLSPIGVYPAPVGQKQNMPWFMGPTSVPIPAAINTRENAPLRIGVVSVTKEKNDWQLQGSLVSGSVGIGDQIVSSPSNQITVVKGVPFCTGAEGEARDVVLSFADPFFAERGEIISHCHDAPLVTDVFSVRMHWREGVLRPGDRLSCKTSFDEFEGVVQSIERVLDPEKLTVQTRRVLEAECFAEITVRTAQTVATDTSDTYPLASLIEVNKQGGGSGIGLVSMEGYADQRRLVTPKSTNITPVENTITEGQRRQRNGHDGGVLWFTGLSGSGKSTLAMALEARLFEQGYQVFVLDGDNVRQGLTSNLGFSPDDRAENIRRVGEVAALFRQAGILVISSFISPYRSDRDRARHTAQSGFHEVFIKADVKTCIERDPKGLYQRALRGDIQDFTGISAPYEAPADPELIVDTEDLDIAACVDLLVNYVDRNFRL